MKKALSITICLSITLTLLFSFIITNSWRLLDGFADLEKIYSVSIYLQAVLAFITCLISYAYFLSKKSTKAMLGGAVVSAVIYVVSTYTVTLSYRINSFSTSISGFIVSEIPFSESQTLERKWYGYLVSSDNGSTPLVVSASPLFSQTEAIDSLINNHSLCKKLTDGQCQEYELSWP
ncbi:hypothetical protein ONV78_14745 [Hahella sp. CR1]|uniref:hypothetical protein n=1 Tax=Hahella sp. CR1 TaxID=2992807 RepID=UPI0024422653|nr:hypothetical protein [Hahella sp. CR1]MDG9668999.1 hypothetical protein [Hahella sp. CR1]